jgi:hypothetical protein
MALGLFFGIVFVALRILFISNNPLKNQFATIPTILYTKPPPAVNCEFDKEDVPFIKPDKDRTMR